MKTALAVLGAALTLWAVVHGVAWGNARMQETYRANVRYKMEWMSRK